MNDAGLLIRGGTLVHAHGTERGAIRIEGGRIATISTGDDGGAGRIIDASGLLVFPGFIDAHVHFNEPGRTEWEGIASGSAALVAGGGTVFFDMPLNSSPPTLDAESFGLKREAAERHSLADFALWGGLTPGNLEDLEALRDCGVIGLKAFMSASGISDFPNVDVRTLEDGMKRAAALGLIVAVHAEDDEMTRRLARERIESGRTTVRDYLESRPKEAELEAIRVALDIAGATGCALHIVHVSCAEGIRRACDARASGVDVTAETCPHYLLLTDFDMERLGAPAKCAPPLRSAADQKALWHELKQGNIDTIGSDHSPSPLSMKTSANFFEVWGGIAGCQHGFRLLLGGESGDPKTDELAGLAGMLSANVAKRFRIGYCKGELRAGCDADLTLIDPGSAPVPIERGELHYRHPISPYIGKACGFSVRAVIRRGEIVYENGEFIGKSRGRLVVPQGSSGG